MDLNRLYSSHQIALIDAMQATCAESRIWAEHRAEYYAARIADFRSRMIPAPPRGGWRTGSPH